MTVAELIQRLRKLDPATPVCYERGAVLRGGWKTAEPFQGLVVKHGRPTGPERERAYALRGGTVPVVILY